VTFTAVEGTAAARHGAGDDGGADCDEEKIDDADDEDADADATEGRLVSLLHAVIGTRASAAHASTVHRRETAIGAVFLTPVVFAGCPRR
jgi:hypothetical protein